MLGPAHIITTDDNLSDGFKILAPISGEIVGISDASHPLARRRLLGDGCALTPGGNFIVSPFDGLLESLNPEGNSWLFRANNGIRLAMTLSTPEHQLTGCCLRLLVSQPTNITSGQRLAELDLPSYMAQIGGNIALTLPTPSSKVEVFHKPQRVLAGQDALFTVKAKKSQ